MQWAWTDVGMQYFQKNVSIKIDFWLLSIQVYLKNSLMAFGNFILNITEHCMIEI